MKSRDARIMKAIATVTCFLSSHMLIVPVPFPLLADRRTTITTNSTQTAMGVFPCWYELVAVVHGTMCRQKLLLFCAKKVPQICCRSFFLCDDCMARPLIALILGKLSDDAWRSPFLDGRANFRQKNVDDDWLWLRLNPIKLWIYTKKCGTNHQRFSPIFCYLRTFALIEDLFSRYLNTPRKTEPATEEEEWVLNHPDKYSTSRRRRGGGRYVYTRKSGRKGEK